MIQLKEKNAASRADFDKNKAELLGPMRAAKATEALANYVADLRKKAGDQLEGGHPLGRRSQDVQPGRRVSLGNGTEPARVEAKLANGLRVSAVRMPHVRRSVIDIHTRIGSRFESAADNGISHFLEHMLHRGTERYPSAHALAFAFETLGGALSAMTYVDHGALSLGAPPENLSELVRILAEVLLQPIFSGLDVEKGIVREEILESLDEDGRSVDADTLLRALAFPNHPLGFPDHRLAQHARQLRYPALASTPRGSLRGRGQRGDGRRANRSRSDAGAGRRCIQGAAERRRAGHRGACAANRPALFTRQIHGQPSLGAGRLSRTG